MAAAGSPAAKQAVDGRTGKAPNGGWNSVGESRRPVKHCGTEKATPAGYDSCSVPIRRQLSIHPNSGIALFRPGNKVPQA
jgi:hypothetical protein